MVGTFTVSPGVCNPVQNSVTGSYFRLVFPKGSVALGPFFHNTSSLCTDKSYTILRPGRKKG